MKPLDAEIGCATALVVDGNPASRSILTNMLRDFGVRQVVQTSRAADARKALEYRHFDIVVCEYHFEGQAMTGQDLIDDLRLAQILPLSTVVVMISSEAGYERVAEAAEAALDAYLIKPHTEEALRERLVQARHRKRVLRDVIQKIEARDYIAAAELCQARFETRSACWIQAARIGAELWLKLGKPHSSQKLFEAILATGALPWARLGIARSEYQAGGVQKARRTLESLLNDQPHYADAYDVMGRVLLESGEPDAALAALRRGCDLAPGCVARVQKLGVLAFYHGTPHEAGVAPQRAVILGLNSKVFDLQGLVLLALLKFDAGDLRGVTQCLSSIKASREGQPKSARLRRFEEVIQIVRALLERQIAEAVMRTQGLLQELRAPDFEFEAASNLLAVLARLLRREVKFPELSEHLQTLAARFAISRASCELLSRAAHGRPDFDALIRECYASTCARAEEAISHTLSGRPDEAVALLMDAAERTLNAKLMDLAQHTLERHWSAIADREALKARVDALDKQYRSYGTQIRLGQHDIVRLEQGSPRPGAEATPAPGS